MPNGHNFLAYLLDGEVTMPSGFSYAGRTALNFKDDGEGVTLTGKADLTRVLLLSGAPLGAPVAQHGPFVMNNQTEIMQAMRDYQIGKMGFYTEY